MTPNWTPQLNAIAGSSIVALGAWLAWDSLSELGALFVMMAAAIFLLWQGRTVGLVWAWSTLLLGIECLAWPILTMVRIRSMTSQPSDEEMSAILSAVIMGLFSAVFWIAFSYGLFRRAGVHSHVSEPVKAGGSAPSCQTKTQPKRHKKR